MDEWTEILDSGGTLDAVYMDLMKAFDKVPHRRPICKLKAYGISDECIKWVEDFLKDRSQRVVVNGARSEVPVQAVTSGIPQGKCARAYIVRHIHK